MTEQYIGLLIQIPLVGIFVWFSLQLINIFLKAIAERDQQWRTWLESERKANNEMLNRLTDSLAREIATLRESLKE